MRLCVSVDRATGEMELVSCPAERKEGFPTDMSSLVGVCWYEVWGGVGRELSGGGI